MTLTLFEFLTYFCSGIVCLLLAIVLVGIKNGTSEAARKFMKVKCFVAAASFLDVLVDVVVIWLMAQRSDYLSVNYVFAPMIFFFQLYMGAASLLSLFRFPLIEGRKNILRFVIPVVSVVAMHYLVYALEYGIGFDASSYSEFVSTPVSMSISIVLYVVVVVEAVCLGVWMVRAVRRYNRLLMDYYSGNEIVKGKRLTSVNVAFFLYFALALANMASRNTMVSAVAICVTTVLFVVFAISLINLQRLFSVLSPAFTYEERPVDETSCSSMQSGSADEEKRGPECAETAPSDIDEVVKKWSSDSSKPYLRDGLTVAVAAREMGLGCRILSDFLNSVYGMNFNSWINSLRIEEVMHILEKSPMTPVSQIAGMTGFTDASACSRTFRKFIGMTISQYRESLK